jgi:Terminase large subunit, T4likevirus-type, N-terminal
LCALFALPMSDEQLAIYQQCTGRSTPPTTPFLEAWLCCGRRSGKSFMLALIAVFLACFFDWRQFLATGEIGTIMVIAQDRRGARTIMRFALGLLQAVPMLKQQIESTTQESITLKNNIVIEVHTASYRSVRGHTVVAGLLDEIAYWPIDENASEPDVEIINAVRPAMATIPGAMLLCASSPHSRRGALYEAWKKHYAKDGDEVLVWQAATRDMNPSVPQSYIDRHMAQDPARATAEYLAQFRTDLEAFVSREAVEACVSWGSYERAARFETSYLGFIDAAGGSGSDSMTMAIGHYDHSARTVVIDALRERTPPFSPEIVASEFAALLKSYHITTAYADKWGGDWVREQFSKFGISIEPAQKTKHQLYLDLLPTINSKRIDLLEHPRAFNQLIGLERRSGRGADIIDHAPGQHDDLANCIAGVASLAIGRGIFDTTWSFVDGVQSTETADDKQREANHQWRQQQYAAYLASYGGGNGSIPFNRDGTICWDRVPHGGYWG